MAYGTGGTILGVAKVLKDKSPGTEIHLCEPNNAPMLYSEIETEYPKDAIPSSSFKGEYYIVVVSQFRRWRMRVVVSTLTLFFAASTSFYFMYFVIP